jgi:predicted DCC family thiol-disulfide oxidoreductase YuxK
MTQPKSIVFFDGVCNLCNASIDFILKRDTKNLFLVGALQEDFSKKILSNYSIKQDYLESLILLEENQIYFKSTAALRIARHLSGLWPIFYLLIALPVWTRDPVYDWIGRNRYRWFGKKNTCRIASPDEQAKFISRENFPTGLESDSEI